MSLDKPLRVLCISVLYFIIFSKTRFTTAISEEQRKDVEKIRLEISEALSENEEKEVAAKGIIVQPSWTQSKSEANVEATDSAVDVTQKDIDEVKALRDEISRAVQKNEYILNVTNSDLGHTKQIKKAEKQWALNSQGKELLGSLTSGTAYETLSQALETVGSGQDDPEESVNQNGPNIVEAMPINEPEFDMRKLKRIELSKRRTRETLLLKSIEEDFAFNLGEDVVEWEHLVYAGQEYFFGRRYTDLIVIKKEVTKYESVKVLEVGQPISYLETFSHWNQKNQQQEHAILVATSNKVLVYHFNSLSGQIELYWEWIVGYPISSLKYFNIDSQHFLSISSNQTERQSYFTINIYQFEMQTKQFWIAQRLQLQHLCGEMSFLDTGRDVILAVVQNNTAAIYTFNARTDNSDHIHFKIQSSFNSEGIGHIAGFKMGGRSYLALGGLQPQILLYEQGDFVPKTVLGTNFGLVDFFFPIPVRTYRDDLILLVQHRVDFSTHSLTMLETLIWDGKAFETTLPVPCQMGSHLKYGVHCMLDIQRDDGLKGAALLQKGAEISLIVPRLKAESGLFHLHTELLAKNSELRDLEDIFVFLKDWVKEQDDLVAQAQYFLNMPDDEVPQAKLNFSFLESLSAPEFYFSGDVAEIHLNGYKWSDADTHADLEGIMQAIEQLEHLMHGGRNKRQLPSEVLKFETLDLDHVEIDELLVEHVNDALFYIQNGDLDFPGILNLHSLKLLEDSQIVINQETPEETLNIDGDLQFAEINGKSWAELQKNLVFRNEALELATLEVDGEVIVEDNLSVSKLNDLQYPDEFLWSSGPSTSTIQSKKIFAGTLTTNALDTDGVINEINPEDAITLSDAQDWTGLPTFAQLEVSELLELNGTAHGRNLKDVPSNPTLEDFNVITAACNFAYLKVLGEINLYGSFDKVNLSSVLLDVMLPSEDPTEDLCVTSKKSFSSVQFPIDFQITEGFVNDIKISEFLTLHTKQELNMSALEGFIYFNNLTTTGAFDNVEIEDLLKNAVRIDKVNPSPGTQLNFLDDLKANEINVVSSLNGVQDFQTTNENLELKEAHFELLQAQLAEIPKNVVGNARFNGLHLEKFLQTKSWSAPSDIGNIYLKTLTLGGNLEANRMHNINTNFVLNFLAEIDDLPEMILDAKIQVDHVIVTGEVQVNKINTHNFDDDIQLTAVWLNRPNYLGTRLQFVEPLMIQQDLFVEGNFNGDDLPTFIDDIIFRSTNSTILVQAPKSFLKDVRIHGNANLEAINGVPFHAIATRTTPNNFKSTLRINGNLIVTEMNLTKAFNSFTMSNLNDLVRYDRRLQSFVLLGDTRLSHQLQLEDLTIHGDLNDLKSMQDFFGSLLDKNSVSRLKSKSTFTGRINIELGAYIGSLNGLNIYSLLENIVFIHSTQPILVTGPINFTEPVQTEEVVIESKLIMRDLYDCSLNEWLGDTLRVDKPHAIKEFISFAPGSLDGNSILAEQLNQIDLSQIITLHTPQNLSQRQLFSTLYLDGPLRTFGPINSVDLAKEFNNTLLTYGNQRVTSPVTMQFAHVLGDLRTNAPVNNDKNLLQTATLCGELELESPLFFQNITTRNLYTKDLISGINLEKWLKTALEVNNPSQQRITGSWSARKLTVRTADSQPFQNLSYKNYSGKGLSSKRNMQQALNYRNICKKVAKYINQQRKSISWLRKLELAFEVKLARSLSSIRHVYVLHQHHETYLLSNLGCQSQVSRWNATLQKFEELHVHETGYIDQLLVLEDDRTKSNIAFVTKSDSDAEASALACNNTGLNAWYLSNTNLTLLRKFPQKVLDLKSKPQQPLSFFALTNDTVYEIGLDENIYNQTFMLPHITDNATYRFLSYKENEPATIMKGQKLLYLQMSSDIRAFCDGHQANTSETSLPRYQRAPLFLSVAPQSVLKSDGTLIRKFSFFDFTKIITRLLTDLVYRLNLEVDFTQLTIPRSTLYDEHLLPDFVDIVHQLEKHNIYPTVPYGGFNVTALQAPNNPAQVLGMRTVQIVWLVIIEIKEVHMALDEDDSHEHNICAGLSDNLAVLVHDVLSLSFPNATTSAKNYTEQLHKVVERIRAFEHYVNVLIEELQAEIENDFPNSPSSTKISNQNSLESETWPAENVTICQAKDQVLNESFVVVQNIKFEAQAGTEVLNLQIGSAYAPRNILAVRMAGVHIAPGQCTGIKLYLPDFEGRIFQCIPAQNPRALTSIRLLHETVLAYVEDCCRVQLLIYRGVQGFVPFMHFDTTREVKHLLVLRIPILNTTEYELFLATVLKREIKFYKFFTAGPKYTFEGDYNPCNSE